MEVESKSMLFTKKKRFSHSTILSTISLFSLFLILILFHAQPSPSFSPASKPGDSKLRNSVTFLPLKDTRFANTAMEGNTWFMSSLSDTFEENESEYLHFPSDASNGRLLCIKGNDIKDGTKNSYALAYPEGLPNSTTFLKGLAFVSDTFYDYGNLWHGLTAMMPFVGWSMKNGCAKPARLVLFHSGELRVTEKMGLWIQNLMQANFGQVQVEEFEKGEGPYCFEKAVVMRHNVGKMGKKKKLQVSDLLRCKAREFCGINPNGRRREVNVRGEPSIRLTLLMRRGSRSFKNPTAVTAVFSRECVAVDGCTLKVVQSEDLDFCDQVRLMTNTDVLASPHGAQLTNMLFMDRNSSIMEFFPKGWLELAGIGQYAHHWMADQSGMTHRGAWWDPYADKECPEPNKQLECFLFYKDGRVGHNETYFAEWTRTVLKQVRTSKLEQDIESSQRDSNVCLC
ncbi:hypothetical protein ACFX13_020062 [Malus domestica]|uniref:uncharacterized protein n=1 Tax=Malus domestica TaxID=3750 RepID=UPI0007ECB5FE|nr:uncharacterized protein LOC103401957 [Malus domestica]